MSFSLLYDTGAPRRLKLGAEPICGVTAFHADPRRIPHVGSHMQVALLDKDRLVVAEQVGISLLRLGERVERLLLGKRCRDLDTPRR